MSMTENEAKREATFEEEYEILKKEKEELFAMEVCDTEPPFANCVVRRALRCIRKLLEEVNAYRAIGTVEELKTAMLYVSLAKIHGTVGRAIDACAEYESIGTIEEFKALKEKSEPKKPFQPFGTHSYKCPSCWKFVAHEVDDNCDLEAEMAGWCPYCGQKLDWSE